MPITHEESDKSRAGAAGIKGEREYILHVYGSDDDVAIKDYLLAEFPLTINDAAGTGTILKRESPQIEPAYIDQGDPDRCRWTATIRYSPPSRTPKEIGESTYSFDTGGGTQHITQSKQTIGTYVAAGTAPDFKGSIGIDGQGNVTGCDIPAPEFAFEETHYFAPSAVDDAYKGMLFALTGTVLDAPFRGLAIGECLFLGARGSQRGNEDWEITFRFAGLPNKTNIAVGDITVPAKKGWEYLWVRYADVEDAAAKMLVQVPIAATVDRVFDYGVTANLGI